jgi:hypothetical protein
MKSIKTIATTAAFVIALSASAFAQRNLDADRTNRIGGDGAVNSSRGAVNSAPSAVQSAPSAVDSAPSAVESSSSSSSRSDTTQSGSASAVDREMKALLARAVRVPANRPHGMRRRSLSARKLHRSARLFEAH